MFTWLARQYKTNAWFRGLAQAIEGGVIAGLATATANGIDLSRKGLTVLGASILGGIVVAVRNYLVTPPTPPVQ